MRSGVDRGWLASAIMDLRLWQTEMAERMLHADVERERAVGDGLVTCSGCGMTVAATADRCSVCGRPKHDAAERPAFSKAAPAAGSSNGLLVWFWLVANGALIVVGLAVGLPLALRECEGGMDCTDQAMQSGAVWGGLIVLFVLVNVVSLLVLVIRSSKRSRHTHRF